MSKRQCTVDGVKYHTPSGHKDIRPGEAATQAALENYTTPSIMDSKGPVNKSEHLRRRQGIPNFTGVPVENDFESMYRKVCSSASQELPTGTVTILGLSGYDVSGNPKRSQVVVNSERPSQNSQPGHDHYKSHNSHHGGPSSAAYPYGLSATKALYTDSPSYHSYPGAQPAHAMGSQQSVPSIVVNGGRGNDPLDRNGNPQSREFVSPGYYAPEASRRNFDLLSADHPDTPTPGSFGTGLTHSLAPGDHQFTSQDLSMSGPKTRPQPSDPWN
jgi:hypothetical protein